MKSNTHKIADAMACVSREVINQTINLKEELVDSMKNETEYDKPCPSTYRRDTLSLSLDNGGEKKKHTKCLYAHNF